MRRYTNIALPDELAAQMDKVIKKSDLGYKSKSEFVKESVAKIKEAARTLLKDLAEYQHFKKSLR